MNIHPIFVHFPIALLTVYALMELVRANKLINTAYWFYVKACILIIGTLGAFASLSTGELAEQGWGKELRPLIEMHSTFATISTWIFALLSIVYIISWIQKTTFNTTLTTSRFAAMWTIKVKIANYIQQSYLPIILACIGLITITITGSLGGAIVYGPDIDPIVKFIYTLLM